jgi:hypothetical protein
VGLLADWIAQAAGGGGGCVHAHVSPGGIGTDKTAELAAAVASIVQRATADGSYYGELWLDAGIYDLLSAPTLGGATRGNALIPLPILEPASGQKFTLVIRGLTDGAPFLHWDQTVPQRNGAVLRAGTAAPAPDGTWGAASIIGGPTANLLSGELFSNMRLVLDGVLLTAPANPGWIGVDGRRLAQMDVPNAGAIAEGTPAQIQGPSNSNGIGFYFPRPDNNDSCTAGVLSVEGFYYGVAFADHFVCERLGVIYSNTAVFINDQDGGSVHGSWIGYLSAEACTTVIQGNHGGTTQYPLHVAMCNAEVVSGNDFIDTFNAWRGYIGYTCIDGSGADPTVTGCGGIKIVNLYRPPGGMAAPAVPASGVASTPIFRDAAVTISGGTVTGITVDGQALGVTSGTVYVPAGKSITLTYSAAPTWKWVLL